MPHTPEASPEPLAAPPSGDLLAAEGLCKVYGYRPVLRHVAITLPPGSLTLICGPNGAGKSTLLRLLAGLTAPDAGAIRLKAGPHETAFMNHEPCAYPGLTALQNLAFWTRLHGLSLDGTALHGLLAGVGLAEFAHESTAGFSQGMLQRLNLARCFAPRPRLVLLDEPGTGLDREGAALLKEHIASTCRAGGAVAMVSHQIRDFLALADFVLALGLPGDAGTNSSVAYYGPAGGFTLPGGEGGHA